MSEFMCGSRKVDEATWEREFQLPWREAGPPNHLDDKVDSDQYVINKELSLCKPASEFRISGLGVGGFGSRFLCFGFRVQSAG